MNKKKLLLNWDAFDEAVLAGAVELQTHEWVREKTCPGLYGIPRGGLVLAVALSHYLDLPLLTEPKRHCIIIDDVVETGITLGRVWLQCQGRGIVPGDVTAWVWVTKNRGLINRYHTFIEPDTWLCFPWEVWENADKDRDRYNEARSQADAD